jgi:uncharacterized protein YukE
MIPGAPSMDPGFAVAGGDPGAISTAAAIHGDAADMLEMHAAVVAGAASSLDSAWQGQAASSYQQLSGVVHRRFNLAADGARTVAAGLREWSAELERCQRAGRTAMHECEYWLKQQQHWFFQLKDAEQALVTAQAQLSTVSAPNPFTGATPGAGPAPPLAPAPGASDPLGSPFSSLAAVAITNAHNAVTAAQHDVTVAQGKLREATREVLEWQGKGRQAWEDAMTAAERATGTLGSIQVTPPPLAGLPRSEPTFSKPEPWYDQALNIADDVAGGVAAVAGVATALTFWMPGVGEVSAVTAEAAGGAQVGLDWLKVVVDDPEASVTGSIVDTALLGASGVADVAASGEKAVTGAEGAATTAAARSAAAAAKNREMTGKALGGVLNGLEGTYGAGTTVQGTEASLNPAPVAVPGSPAEAGRVLAGAGAGHGG